MWLLIFLRRNLQQTKILFHSFWEALFEIRMPRFMRSVSSSSLIRRWDFVNTKSSSWRMNCRRPGCARSKVAKIHGDIPPRSASVSWIRSRILIWSTLRNGFGNRIDTEGVGRAITMPFRAGFAFLVHRVGRIWTKWLFPHSHTLSSDDDSDICELEKLCIVTPKMIKT